MDDAADTTVTDSTGTNNGTATNTPTFGATGQVDGAMTFASASSEYADIANESNFDFTGDLTISAWIYATTVDSNYHAIAVKAEASAYALEISDSDKVQCAVHDGTDYRIGVANSAASASQWYHAVGVVNGTEVALYLDGVKQTTTGILTAAVSTNDYALSIASNPGASRGAYFDGTIDEVRISDIARSEDWIEACYRNQSGAYVHPWRNGDWPYRQAIVIDSSITTDDLTDFPLMVKITEGTNDVFANAQADADDILFTTADGSTKLPHEIEDFTTTPGSEQLIAWVKLPTLSASKDTVIFMYYGNANCATQQDAANVWDENYVGVWHLGEDPSGSAPQMLDSTSNDNDGTSAGTMLTEDQVAGQIDGSLDFDGGDDYVSVADSSDWAFGSSPFTINLWIKSDSTATYVYLDQAASGAGSDVSWGLANVAGQNKVYFHIAETDGSGEAYAVVSNTAINSDALWHFVTITRSNDTIAIYIDGNSDKTEDLSAGFTFHDSTRALLMGCQHSAPNAPFPGVLDEVRISSSARSAAWIAACYNNQNSPGTYQTETGSTTGGQNAGGTSGTTLRNAVIRNAVIR